MLGESALKLMFFVIFIEEDLTSLTHCIGDE